MVLNVYANRGLPMPKCTQGKIDFGRFGRRFIEADFSGGDLSSERLLKIGATDRATPARAGQPLTATSDRFCSQAPDCE